MTRFSCRPRPALLAMAVASLLAACGGGSDESAAPPLPAPAPAPTTVLFTGRVADGPLQGATACYDTSNNSACESGEPTSRAPSDAGGNFLIDVPTASAGQHRLIVMVPATALDADSGQAVSTAFTLLAPASGSAGAQTVFVSPLSSLVQQQMDASGQTREQALAWVQAQLGLAVSPLADFTTGSGAEAQKAANAAKLVLQTQLQQATALAAAVGQNDIAGQALTLARVQSAVLGRVLSALPSIGTAAGDAGLSGLSGSARDTALRSSAGAVVSSLGLSAEQLRFEAGLPLLPPLVDSSGEGAQLFGLQFSNAQSWTIWANQSTAGDNLPQQGQRGFYQARSRSAAYAHRPQQGVAETWGASSTSTELHWNGSSAWVSCPPGERDRASTRDAQGRASYSRCLTMESGISQAAEVDIAGQGLQSFWTQRLLVDLGLSSSAADWSLANVSLLGSGSLPAGSRLVYQRNTLTATQPVYDTAGSPVDLPSAAAALGGDARSGSPACASDSSRTPAATLEGLVSRFSGLPCVFAQQTDANGSSLNPNEAWGGNTVSMGTLSSSTPRPEGSGSYYTTTRLLRAAFTGSDNGVRFYSCLVRTTGGSTRNCTQVGSGRYRIDSLGDARVMRFPELPAAALPLGSPRVFVERGGKVFFGFQRRVGSQTTSLRLNLTAANAVLRALQLPALQPTDAPAALPAAKAQTQALLKGVWIYQTADDVALLRVGDNGRYLLGTSGDPDAARSGAGIEWGWMDIDPGSSRLRALVETDSNGDAGFSHPGAAEGPVTVSENQLRFDTDSLPRLTEDPNGLVGLWALGSASELRTPHFLFMADGRMLAMHPAEEAGACLTARQGPPGVEFARYSFDAATGLLRVFGLVHDGSGCTGLFDATDAQQPAEVSFTISFSADRKSLGIPGGDTLYRVPTR